MTDAAFDRATLALLDSARVVELETRGSSLAPVHRTNDEVLTATLELRPAEGRER